jgi:hypothetical protein
MTTLLWIAHGLLALVFLMTGMMKLLQSKEQLVEKMPVLSPFSPTTLKLIGGLEVLGAVGILGPLFLGVMPGVVPWAAGLALVMVGAVVAHVRRGEWPMVGMNAVLFALAVFVASQHRGTA